MSIEQSSNRDQTLNHPEANSYPDTQASPEDHIAAQTRMRSLGLRAGRGAVELADGQRAVVYTDYASGVEDVVIVQKRRNFPKAGSPPPWRVDMPPLPRSGIRQVVQPPRQHPDNASVDRVRRMRAINRGESTVNMRRLSVDTFTQEAEAEIRRPEEPPIPPGMIS